MLVIRAAQMTAFSEARRRDFETRLRQDIRRLLGELQHPTHNEELQDQVSLVMEEAKKCGLRTERDVARFVRIRCVQLRSLAGGPLPLKAKAILRSYHASTQRKLDDFESWVNGYCRRQAALRHG
jgi:hypothetical protein